MAFYDDMATVARDLIDDFGAAITLTRTAGEVINPVTGVVTPGSDTVYTPNGIIKQYLTSQIDGTRILNSDRLLVLDDTVEPLQDDVIVSSGETWNIIDTQVMNPAGTPLVYFTQIRK